jgi:hypothetical protein
MKKLAIAIAGIAFIIVCSLIVGISLSRASAHRVFLEKVRPDGITTLAEFLKRFPQQRQVYQCGINGRLYVVIAIHHPKVDRHIPSGPPSYVFDSVGRFVDWSADIGDDPRFNERWSLTSAQTLSPDEFKRFVETAR